jgi:hypothetical protein
MVKYVCHLAGTQSQPLQDGSTTMGVNTCSFHEMNGPRCGQCGHVESAVGMRLRLLLERAKQKKAAEPSTSPLDHTVVLGKGKRRGEVSLPFRLHLHPLLYFPGSAACFGCERSRDLEHA